MTHIFSRPNDTASNVKLSVWERERNHRFVLCSELCRHSFHTEPHLFHFTKYRSTHCSFFKPGWSVLLVKLSDTGISAFTVQSNEDGCRGASIPHITGVHRHLVQHHYTGKKAIQPCSQSCRVGSLAYSNDLFTGFAIPQCLRKISVGQTGKNWKAMSLLDTKCMDHNTRYATYTAKTSRRVFSLAVPCKSHHRLLYETATCYS